MLPYRLEASLHRESALWEGFRLGWLLSIRLLISDWFRDVDPCCFAIPNICVFAKFHLVVTKYLKQKAMRYFVRVYFFHNNLSFSCWEHETLESANRDLNWDWMIMRNYSLCHWITCTRNTYLTICGPCGLIGYVDRFISLSFFFRLVTFFYWFRLLIKHFMFRARSCLADSDWDSNGVFGIPMCYISLLTFTGMQRHWLSVYLLWR